MAEQNKRMLPNDAPIAIIGCGLSGLSTAIALEQSGFTDVTIYERDLSFEARRDGYGLTLIYNPRGVLAQLGVLEDIALSDCPSRCHYLFRCNGQILGYFGKAFKLTRGWGQRGNLRVPRQMVRKALIKKLRSSKILWNHKLVSLKQTLTGSMVLEFEGGFTRQVCLVVAADGIRSSVLTAWLPTLPAPRSLGVRLVLGISSTFTHPLLQERGFYTIDTGKRLFVMPFSQDQYMWQLSFSSNDNKSYSSEELQRQVLDICGTWHAPVCDLVRSTPLDTIWGTLLFDVAPNEIYRHLSEQSSLQRVIPVGDAFHAMSPFKGQGANNALQDGFVISRWLVRAGFESAVKASLREIAQRTTPVVEASREAALFWHSPEVLNVEHKFAGTSDVETLTTALSERGITAETPNLDHSIATVMDELNIRELDENSKENNFANPDIATSALRMAREGDLAGLRAISWEHPTLIRLIRDDTTKQTCLDAALLNGHVATANWLRTEAGCLS